MVQADEIAHGSQHADGKPLTRFGITGSRPGKWDYKPDGSTKHWVGVHPNAGYYEIDTQDIVCAYEHGVVFTRDDIDKLIATALAEKRYWSALAPYNPEIQQHFEASLKPDGWGGLTAVPWYLSLQKNISAAGAH